MREVVQKFMYFESRSRLGSLKIGLCGAQYYFWFLRFQSFLNFVSKQVSGTEKMAVNFCNNFAKILQNTDKFPTFANSSQNSVFVIVLLPYIDY